MILMSDLKCEILSYPSADGKHTVAAYLYTMPGVPVRAVLQLSHGMCEYVQRYCPMAEFYAAQGIALAGNDHLGHGSTVPKEDYGHFADVGGREAVREDLHTMNTLLHGRYPGLPLFLYGHSMGSFFARWYAETWPDSISALVLSGTAGPSAANDLGYLLSGLLAKVHGPRYRSALMAKLNFGSYCKGIAAPHSPNDWLTRDEAIVRAYDADEQCMFRFTAAAYHDMLWVLRHVSSKNWARSIPKNLPVLLIAGDGDPVGSYGAGVRAVWAMLGDAGVQDLTCQIYEGARHELHNEINRAEVFDYVLTWLEDHMQGSNAE